MKHAKVESEQSSDAVIDSSDHTGSDGLVKRKRGRPKLISDKVRERVENERFVKYNEEKWKLFGKSKSGNFSFIGRGVTEQWVPTATLKDWLK